MVGTAQGRRQIAEILAVLVLVTVIGAWLWTRRTSPYPYRDGSSHAVTADCTGSLSGGCWIQLGSPATPGREWTGAINPPTLSVPQPVGTTSIPPSWTGQRVSGTLRIIHSWGTPESATFTSGGTTVGVWGGRPDGHHAFPA